MFFYRNAFRLIVAGGGTGGVTVFVGEQLNHTNAEIIYLDFSSASMKIAKQRALNRKLSNIIWIRSWIEDIRYLGLGLFGELQCSGVLHHLKIPRFSLNILKEILSTDGKLSLMLYGKYGRTGVYHIVNLLKMINHNVHDMERKLKNTNRTLTILPKYNWFVANKFINDHKNGNIGIYDLLLNNRDVAFSIQTLMELIERAGINFIDFDYYIDRFSLKIQYAFRYHNIRRKLATLHTTTQMHISEILQGRIITQSFYASKIKENVADVHDKSNVLYIFGNPIGLRESITNEKGYQFLANEKIFIAQMRQSSVNSNQLGFKMLPYASKKGKNHVTFSFQSTHFNHFLVDRLLHSNRGVSIKTLHTEYRKSSNLSLSNDELFTLTEEFYDSVKDTGMFLLRNQHILPFPKTSFLKLWQIHSA